jgi:hypothetical protein
MLQIANNLNQFKLNNKLIFFKLDATFITKYLFRISVGLFANALQACAVQNGLVRSTIFNFINIKFKKQMVASVVNPIFNSNKLTFTVFAKYYYNGLGYKLFLYKSKLYV